MKHTYKITGMTCNGCKSTVYEQIMDIENVINVDVNLDKGEAEIEMKEHIPIKTFQEALEAKYEISEKVNATHPNISSVHEKSKLQQLKPLLLILLYITIASNLIHYKNWSISDVMLDFMGMFFIVFSFFKMLDLRGFPDSFRMYDPLAKKVPVYAKLYPFLETGLGLMFLMRFELQIALITTLIILSITTFGVTKTLLDKKSIRCACLGTALKLPMTEATFIENAIMIAMAIIMLLNTI